MHEPVCSGPAPRPPGGETRINMVVKPEERQSHRILLLADFKQRRSRKIPLDRINR
jgi:hypothetical protein